MSDQSNKIPVELAREIARQGEVRLGALMTVAIGADTRATTLCGILGATCTAVAAAIFAYLAIGQANKPQLIAAGVMVAALLFLGAIMAAIAASPRDYYVAGGRPQALRNWAWSGTEWRDEASMLDASSQRYAKEIEADSRILDSNTKRIKWSLGLAAASLPLGIFIYFLYPR